MNTSEGTAREQPSALRKELAPGERRDPPEARVVQRYRALQLQMIILADVRYHDDRCPRFRKAGPEHARMSRSRHSAIRRLPITVRGLRPDQSNGARQWS